MRRNVVHNRSSSNSIWEEESTAYWQKHAKPEKKQKKNHVLIGIGILIVVLVGAMETFWATRPAVIDRNESLSTSPESTVTDAMRKQCKRDGVQTGWHQTSCNNICEKYKNTLPKPISHRACMDGCTYGTITATKQVCAIGTGEKEQNCPASVDCASACKPYNDQSPRPTLRKYCENNCAAIISSACLRATKILHKLHSPTVV